MLGVEDVFEVLIGVQGAIGEQTLGASVWFVSDAVFSAVFFGHRSHLLLRRCLFLIY